MPPPLFDRCRRWLLLALCSALAASAWASQAPVELRDQRTPIELWPHATMLADPTLQLSVDQLLYRLHEFAPAAAPHANLGVRRDAVWLRIPLHVPEGASGRWLLDIDYPSLDLIDVHVITDGLPVQHFALGDTLPFSQRLVPAHAHAAALVLEAGMDHELLIRVQTTSSMVVPLVLARPDTFYAAEAQVQMVQGLMAGIGLCLLVYALAHAFTLRSGMFLAYALAVAGTTLFFYAYHGLGPQHLWPDQPWLTLNAAPLAILFAIAGSLWFVDSALEVSLLSRSHSWALRGSSVLALAGALAFAAQAIDYRAAHTLGTVLGLATMLLTLPAALRRARAGDRAAWFVCAGWAAFAVGAATMAALLRGLLPLNFFTGHAFQAGNTLEMLSWLSVLGLRVQQERQAAGRLHAEREVMRSLAETDALTGLPNRRGLRSRLDASLASSSPGELVAVYLLDLDGFKAVNDTLGHDAGDALLIAVALRLRQRLRSRDTVARLGGDDFVVLAEALPGDADALHLGQKLVQAMAEPFVIAGNSCRVGLTVGYALAPLDSEDAAALLQRADLGMYAGKQAGKGCVRRITAGSPATTGQASEAEAAMRQALAQATALSD